MRNHLLHFTEDQVMSTAHTWLVKGAVLALLVAVGLALNPAAAQDILDDFKKDRKLAAAKLEKEVEQALQQVSQLKAKEPAKAMGIMNTYKFILDDDTFLTKERRDQLLAEVAKQIKGLEPAAAAASKKSAAEEQYDKYSKFTPKQGAPKTPYGTAQQIINDVNQKLATEKKYNAQKTANAGKILNDVSLGDIPDGYVSFAKGWKETKEIRLMMANKAKYTPEELALMKAMNSVLTIDFGKPTPFKDVISYLEERTGQSIVVDPAALKELMIDYETPITFSAKKVSFRLALKKILGDVGLAYILKGGVVQVVTPQQATKMMTTASYPIADLLPPPMPGAGPFFNEAREQYYANQIMQMIVMTVEPTSWAVNGGGGTIYYNPVSKAVVVRNSAEMHLSLKGGMGY